MLKKAVSLTSNKLFIILVLALRRQDHFIYPFTMKKYILVTIMSLMLVPFSSCFSQRKDAGGTPYAQLLYEGKNLLVEGKKFDTDMIFTDASSVTKENSNLSRYFIRGAVVFRNCEFQKSFLTTLKEKGSSYYTTFGQHVFFDSCIFWEDVDFRGAVMNGVLNFRNCMFYGNANFEELECMSNAWFAGCFFKKEVRFQNSFFNRKANFFGTTFDSICSFQSTFFNQDAQFSNTKFYRYTDFSLCTFNMGVFFNYSTFFDRSLFNNSSFRDRFELVNATFKTQTEMRACKFFGEVKFDKTEFNESVDLSESKFLSGKPSIPKPLNATVIMNDATYTTQGDLP